MNALKNFIKDESGIIDFVYKVVTVIALIVAVLTLKDNIETRNSAYLPRMKIESVNEKSGVILRWSENGGNVDEKYTQLNMKLMNIGNGNAENVSIEFDESVLKAWAETLSEIEGNQENTYLFDERQLRVEYPYVLMGTDEAKEFQVPSLYWECLREIYINADAGTSIDLPALSFKVICSDIQSVPIEYEYELSFSEVMEISMDSNTGEKGVAISFQLQEIERQNNKNMINEINVLIYVLAISLQVAGALLLLVFSTSAKRLDVIKKFAGKGIITCDEDTMEISYNEDAFRDEYRTSYLNKIAFFYIGAGYLLGVFGEIGNTNKWIVGISIFSVSVGILLLTCLVTDKVVVSSKKANQKITLEEMKEAGVKPDLNSISGADIDKMFKKDNI